jgi:hypothetical protein
LCRAWRDGLAPLSAKGDGTPVSGAAASASDVGLVDDNTTCEDADVTNATTTKSFPLPPGLDAIERELERI